MCIERVTAWAPVREFFERHLELIGDGMRREDIPHMERFLKDARNWFVRVAARGGEGLFVFVPRGAGEWEVHACAGTIGKGWRWIGVTRAVLRWFFEESGARALETYVVCKQSGVYALAVGFREVGKFWYQLKREEARKV